MTALKRSFFILGALFLALAGLLLFVLTTPWPAEMLRSRLAQVVGESTGGLVSIDRLELRFLPPRIFLDDVHLQGVPSGVGEWELRARRVELTLPYRVLVGRFDRVEGIRLIEPQVSLIPATDKREPAGGGTKVPEPGGGETFSIGRLEVMSGSMRYVDPSDHWEVEFAKVMLEGKEPEASRGLEGRLEESLLVLRREGQKWEVPFRTHFHVDGKGIAFPDFELNREQDAFQISGEVKLDASGPSPLGSLQAEIMLEEPPPSMVGWQAIWGRFQVGLEGRMAADGVHLGGKLEASRFGYAEHSGKDLKAKWSYDSEGIRIEELEAAIWGGQVGAEAMWQVPPEGVEHSILEARLSLSGLSLQPLMKLLDIENPDLEGRFDHRGQYTLIGLQPTSLRGEGNIRVVGVLSDSGNRPVTGESDFDIKNGAVEIHQATLSSLATQLRFQGVATLFEPATLRGDVEMETEEIAELFSAIHPMTDAHWDPLKELLHDSAGARARFEGNLELGERGLSLGGRLSATDLTFRGERLGNLESDFAWLPGELQVSRVLLQGGRPQVLGSGTCRPGAADGSRPLFLDIQGDFAGLDAVWVQDWLDTDLSVGGDLSAHFEMAGAVPFQQGRADWNLDSPQIGALSLDKASGRFLVEPGALVVDHFRLSKGEGFVEAVGRIGLGGELISIQAQAQNLDLEWLRDAGRGDLEIEGILSGKLEATGTLAEPRVVAELESKDILIEKLGVGAVSMHLTADANEGVFEVLPDERGLALTGTVGLQPDHPFQLDLKLTEWSVPLSQLVQETGLEEARLILSGDAEASGTIAEPSRLDVSGSLTRVAAFVGDHQLEAEGPVVFRWRPPNLELTPFHLLGLGSVLALSGELDPVAGVYRFGAEGNFPLTLLAPLWPALTMDGKGTLSLALSREEDRFLWKGWLDVAEGRLQGGGLPFPISDLAGRLVLEADGSFHLEGVHMLAGGGDLKLDGGGRLRTLEQLDLDLRMDGTNIEIRYPEGFRARYDLDLRLVRSEAGSDLTGDINLVRGAYSQDFKIESRLLSLGGRESVPLSVSPEQEPDILDSIRLALTLKADRELWINNDFATLEGAAALKVGGTFGSPEVTGRYTAFEGGSLFFNRVRYRVVRGNIDLIDRDRLNPYFDLGAETRVGNYQINLQFDGNLDSFTYELSSNPPLSQPDIVSLLVSGRTLEKDPLAESGNGYSAGGVATGYLTAPLTDKIGGRLATVTGLDQFSIDPIILSREGDPASRLTLGKQISENLFAIYSTVLGNSSSEVYQLEYKITSGLKFTSLREADGAVGGDLRYVWRTLTSRDDRPVTSPSPPRTLIREVLIEGESNLSRRKILRLLQLRPGKGMNRVQAMEGEEHLLNHLQKQGYLQAKVDLSESPVAGTQGIDLNLAITPGPVVEIDLRNVPRFIHPDEEIRAVWTRTVFPEEAPEEVRARLEQRLMKQGFTLASVGLEVLEDSPKRRSVILTAYPGPRYELGSVEFRGNKAVSTPELEAVLGIRSGKKMFLDPERPRRDALRLRGYYLALGYTEVQIPLPILEMNEERSQALLRFEIQEGEPARIATIRLEGNKSLSDSELRGSLSLREGQPFSKNRAQSGVTELRREYDGHGFADPVIRYEYHPGAEGGLLYLIEEGPRKAVGEVLLEGNHLTRNEVIERELTFAKGDPVSREEILKSQRALYRLGLFRTVEITEEPGPDPGQPDIRIKIAEMDNLTQSIGGGYSSDGGARAVYEATDVNVRGNGQTVGLALRAGAVDNAAQLILKDPYLFNRRLDSLLSGFWSKRERASFIERTVGSTFQVSNPHGDHDKSIFRYLFKDVNVSSLEITEQEAGVEQIRLSGLGSTFVRDTRDNFYNPRTGLFASFNLEGYGRALGSGAQFWKFLATGKYFHRVSKDSVWASSVRVGLADPFGNTELVPLSERFFAGGDTTIRGFNRDEVGPKDPLTNEPVGGATLFIINQELRYPLWGALRGLVFVDAGNVTSHLSEFDFTGLRTSAGLGLRVETPIGPLRLEYGWKLDPEEDEESGRLHFSIGQAF